MEAVFLAGSHKTPLSASRGWAVINPRASTKTIREESAERARRATTGDEKQLKDVGLRSPSLSMAASSSDFLGSAIPDYE